MDIILPKDVEKMEEKVAEKPKEHETSIDLDSQTKVMTIKINMTKGVVNAYGTIQYAMELACRYFTTLEILKRKEDDARRIQEEKERGAIGSRLTVPGR